MSKISQRASVSLAVEFVMGKVEGKVTPTSEQRKQIIELVALDLAEGRAEFSEKARQKYNTMDKIKSYTSGMVSNWLRKDTELNGGERYTIKNPGSRAGQGDEVLKNYKNLRLQLTQAKAPQEQLDAVDEAIKAREQEITATKAKSVTVNLDILPEHLRKFAK